MPSLTAIPPPRRPDLVLRPLGDDGRHVVKDLRTGAFFNLGPVEAFLLLQLDGRLPTGAICAAFAGRFGEPLSPEDLDEFLGLARERGFPRTEGGPDPDAAVPDASEGLAPAPSRPRQSLLCWRASLFDPDRLFNWLEPRLRFVWTRG